MPATFTGSLGSHWICLRNRSVDVEKMQDNEIASLGFCLVQGPVSRSNQSCQVVRVSRNRASDTDTQGDRYARLGVSVDKPRGAKLRANCFCEYKGTSGPCIR